MTSERPRLIERIWHHAVTGGLVYNQSLDDPELDRQALRVGPSHACVVSTSGGCNALGLLCEEPTRLIAVDPNPVHNHLAELKRAAIYSCTPDEVFALFGRPRPRRAASLYRNRLRHVLPAHARRYWDAHVGMLEKGIITQGRVGLAFRLLRHVLWLSVGRRDVYALLSQPNLESQQRFYHDRIAKRLWTAPTLAMLRLVQWWSRSRRNRRAEWSRVEPPAATAAGGKTVARDRPRTVASGSRAARRHNRHSTPVPRPSTSAEVDLCERLRGAVDAIATGALLSRNYFVVQALAGRYLDRRCVPAYLLAENLEKLPRLLKRLELVTGHPAALLEKLPAGSVDRMSLIVPSELQSPGGWEGIRRAVVHAAARGARIVVRGSASAAGPLPAAPLGEEVELGSGLQLKSRFPIYPTFHVLTLAARDERPEPSGARVLTPCAVTASAAR